MSTATAEAPRVVATLPGGTPVNAGMSSLEIFNAALKEAGAPAYSPPSGSLFGYSGPPLNVLAAPGATAPTAQPREDGSSGAPAHAGMIAPSPQELAAANSGDPLAQFDREMQAAGIQRPASEQQAEAAADAERFQRDPRTGAVVDVHALERAHELYRSIPAAERESARGEYEQTLADILAGKLGLADMEDMPGTEQPRDAQGRYAPAQPAAAPTYSPEQWAEGHASVTTADGWIPLERINQAGLSGYTLPRLVEGQTYHRSIFADLARARAAGVTQAQVAAYIREGMRAEGFKV